ncbi:hypothetical protein [Rhodococcus globerulus]|uniref:hypothetical protein n=1 Tax=Rhodococcus globerulus TaxID=33008 RepID=UPI001C578891|nr:hypothetical protein [Rhodococcus globerulus]QXW02607.1 hypothetical protein KYT97_00270 [Rhodococcus globerulus]
MLKAKFQAEFQAAGHKSQPAQALEAKVAQLEDELAKVRQTNRVLNVRVRTYATMIEQLAVERDQAEAERDRAHAARDETLAKVTPISIRLG